MPSMYQTTDQAQILTRIRSLRADSNAQWGKMDVAQMLAHCQMPLQVAMGDMAMKRMLLGLLFGRIAKKKLGGPGPYEHDLPTAPQFVVRDRREFASEQQKLVALVETFTRRGPGVLVKQHPFFGPMTSAEWDTLMWKHLDHHLRQFGA